MPTTPKARPRRKTRYHIRNWAAYDQALVKRGALTVWISDEALDGWAYSGPAQRGAQLASNLIIYGPTVSLRHSSASFRHLLFMREPTRRVTYFGGSSTLLKLGLWHGFSPALDTIT